MDELIEFILEFVLDIGVEVAKDKKTPKPVRYFFMALILIGFSLVVMLLFWLSLMFLEENILIALFFFIIDIILVISGITKIKTSYLNIQDKTKLKK